MSQYEPPITLTPELVTLTTTIAEQLGRITERKSQAQAEENSSQRPESRLDKNTDAKLSQLAASISCNNVETVRQRIAESEAGQYLTDEEYERSMDEFFC